jgi:hypothetical protein
MPHDAADVTDREVANTWTMAARPHVIDGGQFASPPAARRAVPARAPAGTVRRIPQNLFYQFAFADDRPLLNAPDTGYWPLVVDPRL